MVEIVYMGEHVIKPDMVYPNFRFFVEMDIDREYIEYLKALYGTMPGTEILKTNCAASSCFTLGAVTTEDYSKETLEGQLAKYKAQKAYGRDAEDLFSHVANTFKIKGRFEYTKVVFKFREFKMADITHRFNKMMEAIKNALGDNTGTFLVYGGYKDDGVNQAGAHIVSIIKTNGRLTLYDYQQQYCVEEPYILQTIINQSLPGIFNVQSSNGFSLVAYEGYQYIKQLSESYERLFIEFFCPLAISPMYSGPGLRSLGIMNRIRLYRDIQSSRFKEILLDAYRLDKEEILSFRDLEERAEYVMESYGNLTIEPWFLPTNLMEEKLLRELAEHRVRHWPNTTAEERRVREEEIQKSIQKDMRTKSIAFANDIDLRIMRDDIVSKLGELIMKLQRGSTIQIRKVKGAQPMNLSG